MSKSLIGEDVSAEMTEGQTYNAAPQTKSADEETGEPESERAELLKLANSLISERPATENPSIAPTPQSATLVRKAKGKSRRRSRSHKKAKPRPAAPAVKHRFGLPEGFVPSLQRFGRSVLLELNIYRLPNGAEYLPTPPLGTLGSRQHLYALLSVDQYLARRRGPVYVRTDGRIFDYSVDSGNPGDDIFDTGYTIYDLERTGGYAPSLNKKKEKRESAKYRGATAGS